MTKPLTLAIVAAARPFVEPHLPTDIDVRWIGNVADAIAHAPGAEIGWLDLFPITDIAAAVTAAADVVWLNTMFAGIDLLPAALLKARGTVLTNGSGVHSVAVSEYAVMGMLALAKYLPDVVRAHDRREWLATRPAFNLAGSRALIVGYGSIGRAIADRLRGFGVDITGVRRTPDGEPDVIGIDAWRERLGEFDWVILAAPGTGDTRQMIGAVELAAMKPGARLVNIARGSLVDQDALIAALGEGRIAGAFLDTVDPEPLPPEHPLWQAPNTLITMHLSGRSQTGQFERASAQFLANLERWRAGEPLANRVDFAHGY